MPKTEGLRHVILNEINEPLKPRILLIFFFLINKDWKNQQQEQPSFIFAVIWSIRLDTMYTDYWHRLLFLNFVHRLKLFKLLFKKPAQLPSWGNEALNLVDSLGRAILSENRIDRLSSGDWERLDLRGTPRWVLRYLKTEAQPASETSCYLIHKFKKG
jgi:hypothetical protein